jgi:hypothetical protein
MAQYLKGKRPAILPITHNLVVIGGWVMSHGT